MKSLFFAALFVLFASVSCVEAQSVQLTINLTVTNLGSEPADTYRLEEEAPPGTWTAVTTIAAPVPPATTASHVISGRGAGLYTFRWVPMKSGLDGMPSNAAICGAVPPDTTISISCSAQVIP